jgi:apolipoprotein N-acyltransferase
MTIAEHSLPASLAALSAGALMPLGFAPLNAYWLLPPALAVLFWLSQASRPGRALWLGWLFGLGMFAVGVSWVYVSIHDMGHLDLWLAGLITALFVAVLALLPGLFGWLVARLPVRAGALGTLTLLPAVWVATEWLRGQLFTGFPWLWLGHSQVDGPLAPLLPVSGSLGVSWLLALSAAVIVLWLPGGKQATDRSGKQSASWRWIAIALLLSLWLLVALVLPRNWTEAAGDPLRFSLVQGGQPQQLRWDRAQRARSVSHYLELMADEWGRDLVVWPENALPLFYHQIGSLREQFDQRGRETDTSLLIGMPYLDRDSRRYYNSAIVFPEPAGRYDKRHLVPFTEYLPFKRWLKGPLDFFQVPMSDFALGADNQALLQVKGVPIAVSICYEAAYPAVVFAGLPDARLLINLSNDGWFGDTLGPHQHLQIARVRALESGRWMLRATNTGITALIDPAGDVVSRAPRFEPAVLRGEVQPMVGETPYVRWGDGPVLGSMILLLIIGISGSRRSR